LITTSARTLCLAWALALAACQPAAPKFKSTDITGADYGKSLQLAAHDGKPRTFADFAGKVVIVTFGFTHCPDVCPTTLALLASVQKQAALQDTRMAGLKVALISVDPERDSPEQMGNYIAAFGGDLIGLTGSTPEIVKATQTFGVAFARVELAGGNYTMDHSATVFALDSDANIVAVFTPPLNAAALTRDLARLAPILGKS
jgi:protein SCO1/2